MARVLIVGGGCRGRRLAGGLAEAGHAARIVTRTEAGRAAIEACGAECLIGDPRRLATLRGALDGVTIACWLLATVSDPEDLRALHGPRLEAFMGQAIDSTMRGFVYEAPRTVGDRDRVPGDPTEIAHEPRGAADESRGAGVEMMTVEGERIVERMAARNAIPIACLRADPRGDLDVWLAEAMEAVGRLLDPEGSGARRSSAMLRTNS